MTIHGFSDRRLASTLGLKIAHAALWAGRIPIRSTATTGRGVILAGNTLRWSLTDAILLRLRLVDIFAQTWTLQKVTIIPALLMAVPFGAMISIQSSGLINQVGATSLLGAASGIGVVRQAAPITAGLLMGGAAAASIASDFGARAIREELLALQALNINLVRYLVVPRFLALLLLAPILCTFIVSAAVLTSYVLAVVAFSATPGGFWMSFGTFARPIDVWFALGKALVFAAIVAIISSQRGIEAKGGPRGVADAVNASVVLSVVCIAIANTGITQIQQMFVPMEIS